MTPLLPLVVTVALASPQTSATGASGQEVTRPERRVFDVSSRDAWTLVQERLRDLGLAVDKVDRKDQALLTKWWSDFMPAGWLPEPQMPKRYHAPRIRFEVFVSPFVEPATVYVGSQLEADDNLVPDSQVVSYNVSYANRALMAEIDGAFARASLPKYVPNAADPCLRQITGAGPGKITKPERIPLSEFKVIYPKPALESETGGNVVVELLMLKDGGVGDIRVTSSPVGEQMDKAAMGAVSLLLYSPVRVDGCPSDFIMRYTVRFRGP